MQKLIHSLGIFCPQHILTVDGKDKTLTSIYYGEQNNNGETILMILLLDKQSILFFSANVAFLVSLSSFLPNMLEAPLSFSLFLFIIPLIS